MTYSALSVASYLLHTAHMDGEKLNLMKLQRLVFFCHGWHLAIYKEPLIKENVEAWSYGPVIPSIYHEYVKYGNNSIDRVDLSGTGTGNYTGTHLEEEKYGLNFLKVIILIKKIFNLFFNHLGNYLGLGKSQNKQNLTMNRVKQSQRNAKEIIQTVWCSYGIYSAEHLSNLMHQVGTPWEQVYSQSFDKLMEKEVITNESIQKYFEDMTKQMDYEMLASV